MLENILQEVNNLSKFRNYVFFLQFFIQNKAEKTGVQEHKVLENNQESNKCTSSRNSKTDSTRTRRSSIDLYEEAAAILGLTCSQTDSCRCIECQVNFLFSIYFNTVIPVTHNTNKNLKD